MPGSQVPSEPAPAALDQLFPKELVSLARGVGFAEFMSAYGEKCFLLIKLDDGGELQAGLRALEQTRLDADGGNQATIGTQTAVVDIVPFVPDPADRFTTTELGRRLAEHKHYAITLESGKAGAGATEKISVGRGGNSGMVLCHPSVSKLHAWFNRDAGGSFSVADAHSKNGTRVNQMALPPDSMVRITGGDVVRFGSVETIVCPSSTIWRAAHGK